MRDLKEQFLLVFSNDGHYQWAKEYKKQYIYALRESLDNKPNDLPENIITKKPEEIFEIVIKYDTDLKLFRIFNRDYELYSKKTIELFHLSLSEEEKKSINSSVSQDYDFEITEDWKKIGTLKENTKISYIFAQSSYETTSKKIDSSSFSSDEWNKIGIVANSKNSLSYGKLLYIDAKLISPKRKILKLSFDIESDIFNVSYDSAEVDENGKKINQDDSNRKALNKIIPTLPISDSTKNNIISCITHGTNSLVTQKALDNISFLSEDNILVIPTSQKLNIENKKTTEHSERITSDMYNQRSSDIEKAARIEYENYGTLKDFLTHNPKHNTKDNEIKKIQKTKTNSEFESFRAYVVVIRTANEIEKPISSSGNLKNKVLDLLSVDFDYINNEMTIRNSNYSGESQDVIIHKILELSK